MPPRGRARATAAVNYAAWFALGMGRQVAQGLDFESVGADGETRKVPAEHFPEGRKREYIANAVGVLALALEVLALSKVDLARRQRVVLALVALSPPDVPGILNRLEKRDEGLVAYARRKAQNRPARKRRKAAASSHAVALELARRVIGELESIFAVEGRTP